jgi:hypothetical protein
VRSWRRDWKVFFDPGAKVVHHKGVSSRTQRLSIWDSAVLSEVAGRTPALVPGFFGCGGLDKIRSDCRFLPAFPRN